MFDTLVFVLTVYKSIALRQSAGSSLLTLMVRDGVSQFVYIPLFSPDGNRLDILLVRGLIPQLMNELMAEITVYSVMMVLNVGNILTFVVRPSPPEMVLNFN